MNIILPQDVSDYIFIFLFFSSAFKKIFCLSKLTTKSLKNMNQYKTYNEFMENIKKMREDKSGFFKNISLEKQWFKYNTYKWPNVIKNIYGTNAYSEDIFSIGDYVDAKDFVKAWCPAKIIDICEKREHNIDPTTGQIISSIKNVYEVEFFGWSSKFNEKVNYENIKKLTTSTTNPRNKIINFYRPSFEPFWCLIKKKAEVLWNMSRITERIIDNSTNIILVKCAKGNIYEITKENIDDIILPISDASCFMAIKTEHTFDYMFRKFYL
jgi:hypothetical protein